MLRLRLPGLPRDPVVEAKSGRITFPWIAWLQTIATQLDGAPYRMQTVSLAAQAATVPVTAVPLGRIPTALYRVTFTLRVTQAASSSSSAAITIGWTDGGVACSQTWTAVTGNTTATIQTGTLLLRAEQDTPITYAVAYSSAGATPMQFAFDLVVEVIPGGGA